MVNYPKGSRKSSATSAPAKTGAGKRGMELEKEINQTNEYYLSSDRAAIHKKPTPVQVVRVDYPMRSAARIVEAYYKLPSTTDYNGIYRGKYIDFEAKECRSLTSFPLKSIHAHQIKHLETVLKHGAIAFVIIRFTSYEETYLIPAEVLNNQIRSTDKSSIPYQWFKENGYLIPFNYVKPVDYLKIVDDLYFKE